MSPPTGNRTLDSGRRYRTEQEMRQAEFEKRREEYLRRKREEEMKERQLHGSSSTAIEVEDVEVYAERNAQDHHTELFELVDSKNPQLVLRRGQPFYIAIRFKRDFDISQDNLKLLFTIGPNPQISKRTMVQLTVTDRDSFGGNTNRWDVRLHYKDARIIHLHIQIPCIAIVGVWKLTIESNHQKATAPHLFEVEKSIYILFNPWCKEDTVYMENEQWRDEYVMNESGKLFVGTHKQPRGRRWIYGQFSSAVLPASMAILDRSSLDYVARAFPVRVVRAISAMVNSEDNSGVIKGRWDGNYEDGTAPWIWTGSNAILEQYLKNGGNEIKYGQCWVFAAVTTSVCRALGIPCRPVTNFVSAHDTDDTLTIDQYFESDGEKLRSQDSIWNYHVWNDCWMARPDLPSGYGGWQAVDATPQETSDGIYQTGPASIEAIRKGHIGFLYDSPFVFSEVNADVVHWQKDDQEELGWRKLKTNKYHIGKMILTKKVGVEDFNGDSDKENILEQYKSEEGTAEERMSIRNAATYGSYSKIYELPTPEEEDVFFDLIDIDKIMIGQTFNIVLHTENLSNSPRTVFVVMSASSVYYTGIKAHTIKKVTQKFVLNPHQKESLAIPVTSEEYYEKLVDYSLIKIYAIATIRETKQTWTEEDDFTVEKPKLELQVTSPPKVGQQYQLLVAFTNPLNRTLEECKFMTEGPGLAEPHQASFRDIGPGERVIYKETLIPKRAGKRNILVVFSSKQLIDVQGSTEVEVG